MRGWRTGVAIVVAAAMCSCAADHAVPHVASPFDPPPTAPPVTATVAVDDADDDVAGPGSSSAPASTEEPSSTTAPATTVPPSTTTPADRWAAFDAALAMRLLGSGDYAIGVAIAVDGRIVHAADYGVRVPSSTPLPDPSIPPSSVPATPLPTPSIPPSSVPATTAAPAPAADLIELGDRFRIASLSKVITAIVVLQLVEAGQLGLDDPVGERLAAIVGTPLADPRAAAITVRQLLSHTSGFPEYQSTFFRGHVDSCPAAGQFGLSRSLTAQPGTRYEYSNLNFCLLGLLVADVAGRPYEAVVTDRLLAPLGIVDMRLATTYDADPGLVVHPSAPLRNYMEVLGAAGSWVATPSDMVTILASLDPVSPGFHPLSPPLVELMRTPVLTAERPDPTRGYGLGLMVFGDGAVGHTGTIESTHAIVVDRADGVTWSVLVSGEYPGSTGSLAAIFDRAIEEAGVAFR